METTNDKQIDLQLKSFDLGEADGGRQIVLAHKCVSEKEHYLLTMGNGPKIAPTENENADSKLSKNQIELNMGNRPFNNEKQENDMENLDNFKLRCFKLSKVEGKKYLLQEYVTPEGIYDVAKMFAPNVKGEK